MTGAHENSLSVVVAPDSFKGSLAALDVAAALADGIRRVAPAADIRCAPMADGGEGTLDCVAARLDGQWNSARLEAIDHIEHDARWFMLEDGTAVLECAEVLGLPLIEQMAHPPALSARSSAPLGRLISAALDTGATALAIGLGGSACNDAGLGMLAALGAQAFDANDQPLAPSMQALLDLNRLDLSELDPRLADCPVRVLCDVDNPLLGEQGASRIYGPQKGLTDDDIQAVEAAFERMARAIDATQHMTQAGSGAAGGLGFALAVIGGALESGAKALIEITGLTASMQSADCVITGEGRSDRQTLSGKLPMAVAQAGAPTPTRLVCGAVAEDAQAALDEHFVVCHTLVERAGSVEAAMAEPARWLADIGADIAAQLIQARR